MCSSERRIDLDDELDRRRYRCPRGHASWEATNGHFYCCSCARSWEFDGEFTELRDAKTGELLERGAVELTTSAGDYEDLFGGRRA